MVLYRGLIIIFFILIASPTDAVIFFGGESDGGAACSTIGDSNAEATAASVEVGRYSSGVYIGGQFTPSSDYTICKIGIPMREYGSGTVGYNMQACIYTDDGGTPNYPNTEVDCSDAISGDHGNESFSEIIFDQNLSASVTSDAVFWVVLSMSANDTTDYNVWAVGSFVGADEMAMADSTPTWANAGGRAMKYYVYY